MRCLVTPRRGEMAAQRGHRLVERVPVEHVAAVDLDRGQTAAEVARERRPQLGPHDLLARATTSRQGRCACATEAVGRAISLQPAIAAPRQKRMR